MNPTKLTGDGADVAALDALFQPFNRSDAPGLVVGVARHGRRLYRRGFGLASIEHGVANTPATRMRIGSVSKHFACLAALLLAEDGKLDVDAGVRRYFPALPVPEGEPTLRQLMNHTSGYRCAMDLASLADGIAMQPPGSALQVQLRQHAANFAPGEKMVYCNGGYHLLSLVIEQVAGMPFAQFLQERIFTPVGMHQTASVPSDMEIHPGMATLHVRGAPEQGGAWRRGIFPTEELMGDGAMVSTVDDMLTWLAHMRASKKTVGNEATWRQMLTRTTLNNGVVNPYCLGLFRNEYRGVDVIQHSGGVVGGTCQMITVPGHALDIVIITNGVQANPIDLGNQVIDVLLGADDATAIGTGEGAEGRAAQAPLLAPLPEKPAAERFQPMLGTRYHAAASGMVFGFAATPEGRLGLSFLDSEPVALTEHGDVLRLGFDDLALGPLVLQTAALAAPGQEAPATLVLSDAGRAEHYERLPATPPPPAEAGAALPGRYHAPDLGAEAQVRLDGDKLVLEVFGAHGRDVMELAAFSDRVFSIRFGGEYPPMRGVLCAEPADGPVTALRVNTHRTRNLRFERIAAAGERQ